MIIQVFKKTKFLYLNKNFWNFLGPPTSIADIYRDYDILRQSYPGAQIIPSSLQNFLEDVSSVTSELVLFNRDISDSWLQGIISDPKRVQQYLALQRALKTCFDQNICQNNDPQLFNASRFSTKIPGKIKRK